MRKQIFTRIRKTLAIVVLVSLILFVTAASASATEVKYTYAYKLGSKAGSLDGYRTGHSDGVRDCLEHGKKGVLTEIPKPLINSKWTRNYLLGYTYAYYNKYHIGYNDGRFGCLQKNSVV
jgi:hypothetical protein